MTQKNDGGPAFPSHSGDPEMTDPRNRISCGGMSLRDYFAGQALEGREYDGWGARDVAEMAYEIADAMIEARETNQ